MEIKKAFLRKNLLKKNRFPPITSTSGNPPLVRKDQICLTYFLQSHKDVEISVLAIFDESIDKIGSLYALTEYFIKKYKRPRSQEISKAGSIYVRI